MKSEPRQTTIDRECDLHNRADAAYFREKRQARWMVLAWLVGLAVVGVCGWIRGY